MASPSDSQVIKRRKGPAFEYLIPLVYAPVLPLIRIALRHKPLLRDRLFYGVLAGAFAHGTYLVWEQWRKRWDDRKDPYFCYGSYYYSKRR